MQPTICSRCKKNVAVVFITKIENGQTVNEGLCLKCAKELHIQPVDDMIKRLGMSDEFDMVAMETISNQYLGGDAALACSMETQTQIDQKVVELVRTQHEKALQILQDNMGKLHELAKFLYENETITGEEFMKILLAPPALPYATEETV